VAQAAAVALLARRETGRAAAEALERAAFALCFAARDRGEGVLAFLDKREPRFHETPAQDGWGRPPGGAPGPLPEEDPA
jgi:1,4-dihydroxy-2-naphthoyl-CoA synthase